MGVHWNVLYVNASNPSLLKMFMLPEDYKQAAAIERRRRFEGERKCRIFNARQRLIGVSNPDSLVGCQDLYKVRYNYSTLHSSEIFV
jgi:hypothetical protein